MAGVWEYIPPIVADAATQMAIDAELAERCDRSSRSVFLRFYSMSPPAVSIGRNQQWRTVVEPGICQRNGWDWVRRPTGGGALLHHREINYAVAAGHDVFPSSPGDVLQSVFRHVAEGLLAGLVQLGFLPRLNAARKSRAPGEPAAAHGLCASALTRYEISINGMKAVAAAQWNLSRASLQHGTIYLHAPEPQDRFWPEGPDRTSPSPPPKWWAFDDATTTLEDRWSVLAGALRQGLTQTLGIPWHEGSCSWATSSEVQARRQRWHDARWRERR